MLSFGAIRFHCAKINLFTKYRIKCGNLSHAASTINAGVTLTVQEALIIYARNAVTINGQINAAGVGRPGSGISGTAGVGGAGGNAGISPGSNGGDCVTPSGSFLGAIGVIGPGAPGSTLPPRLVACILANPQLFLLGGASGGISPSAGSVGGTGGGVVIIVAPSIIIAASGGIFADGAAGSVSGGGGGGGLIALRAKIFSNSGTLQANGGPSSSGASSPGGPGGPGVIQIDIFP